MANASRNLAAHVTIGMAFGQAVLAFALSWVASLAGPLSWEDYQWYVELPLYFAVVPSLAGLGLMLHVRFCGHVDRSCPWIALASILLMLNLAALVVFVFSEP